MKSRMLILAVMAPMFLINQVFAIQSASVMTNGTVIAEGVNSAANASYGSQNAAHCGSRNFPACIRAMLGFAQMYMSLKQMFQTAGSRDLLSTDTDWSNPGFGTEFGSVAAVDQTYFKPIIEAIESGDMAAYEKAKESLFGLTQPDIDRLKALGFSADIENGIINTPDGPKKIEDLKSMATGGNFADYEARTAKALAANGSGGNGSGNDKNARNKAGGKGSGFGDGSSGDGRGLASSLDLGGKDGSSVDSFLNKLNKGETDANKLVGMSKLTKDGDSIGVAMGNLFKTIHVKYKNLDTKKEFK